MAIVCKSPAEIEKMRQSGRVVRQVLDHLRTLVAPGVSTMDLERAAEQKMKDLGAKPAFKGYYDYPCVLCTSVNEEIVHGIPSDKRKLNAGDIVSVDCGVVLDSRATRSGARCARGDRRSRRPLLGSTGISRWVQPGALGEESMSGVVAMKSIGQCGRLGSTSCASGSGVGAGARTVGAWRGSISR